MLFCLEGIFSPSTAIQLKGPLQNIIFPFSEMLEFMGEYNCKQQQLVKSSHITLIFHHEKTKGTILHHILSINFINNSDAKTSSQKKPQFILKYTSYHLSFRITIPYSTDSTSIHSIAPDKDLARVSSQRRCVLCWI